ncbi:MAG: glycosyl transferase [Planctomycetota bacterium]
MNVAIVQEHLDPRRGGAETSVLEMARELAACGAEVTLVCASAPPEGAASGVEVRVLDVGSGSKRSRTRRFIEAADLWLAAGDFDIIHAVTPCRSCNVYQPRGGTYRETIERTLAVVRNPAVRAVKRFGRAFNFRQRMLLGIEEEILNRPEPPFVAAVSEYARRQVLAIRPGYPAERLCVVFNGVTIAPLSAEERATRRAATRASLAIASDAPVLLLVAHNFRLKGLGELIRALADAGATASDAILLVAGRDAPGAYQRLADRLGIGERVRFVGARMPVRDLFAAADLLVHPTWYDPCSRVVLEALCCGVPVVTTRVNGAADAIAEGETGIVVATPADERALRDAIAAGLNARFRTAARERADEACERLSMRRHARELLDLYSRVSSGA